MNTLRVLCILFLFFLIFTCSDDDNPTGNDEKEASSEITVGPEGGDFDIDENMILTVPPGAVSSETDLTVSRLGESGWQSAFDNYGEHTINGLSAFSITPGDVQFNKAVRMRFKAVDCQAGIVPLVHTVDRTTGSHVVDSTVTLFDNENDSLSVAVLSGGDYVVEANSAWASLAKKQGTLDCREGLIIVESNDSDVQCSEQDCQILESMVKVQFLSCPGQPVESAVLRESSQSCHAVMTLSGTSNSMQVNSTMSVNATIKIACMEVNNQTVNFSATGVGSVSPAESNTNAQGVATTTLSSEDKEGKVTVTAEAEVRYPVREIIINGSVEESFHRREPVEKSVEITVKDLPTWHIEMDVALVNAPHNWGVLVDYVNYAAHVETDLSIDTTVNYATDYSDVFGTQNLGEITLENLVPEIQTSVTLTSTNAPSSFPCRVQAWYDKDAGNVNFFVTDQGDDADFATWDIEIRYIEDLQPPWNTEHWIGGFWPEGALGNEFYFPANETSYSISGGMTTVIYDGTYELSVTKVSD
ncbi:MAG: Ig-like domain-containing protein [Calditrichaceae bacterium]|nr:Ig-like domain-containing protein [Calditrichaceae bacterium]